MTDGQNAPDDSVGKGLRYARRQYGACERRSYDDGGHAEPAPPQTAEQQVRDLERIIERVREVVGTDQPLNSSFHCAGYASEARVAVAEYEANAYRNQVSALVREFQRLSQGSDVDPFAVIILDGRPDADAIAGQAAAVTESLAALARQHLGIDLTIGQPIPADVLATACRELAKSEDARQRLHNELTATRTGIRGALGLDNDEAIDAYSAARDIARELERSREAIRSVIHLHRGEGHRGQVICAHCSALDDQGTTDNSPVGYPCDTVQRIWEALGPDADTELVARTDPEGTRP